MCICHVLAALRAGCGSRLVDAGFLAGAGFLPAWRS
jgi:hypothetical protein